MNFVVGTILELAGVAVLNLKTLAKYIWPPRLNTPAACVA